MNYPQIGEQDQKLDYGLNVANGGGDEPEIKPQDFESDEPLEPSDSSTDEEDDLYHTVLGPTSNTRTTGIQTSENHFKRIKANRENKLKMLE